MSEVVEAVHPVTTRRPPRSRPGEGSGSVALHHQPQGHRHAVPVVQLPDVPDRGRAGACHPHRAVPAGSAVRQPRVLQPDDDQSRPHHGIRRHHAGLRGARELARADDGGRAGHGAAAHEQPVVLDPAVCLWPADLHAVHGRWRSQLRLDVLCAAIDDLCAGYGDVLHLRCAHDGRLLDHGQYQHHRHHPEHAGAGHDPDADAAVRLDLADHRLPAAGRHAGTGRCGHHDAVRHPLRHQLLQRGRWRRPGDVPAHLLVLRAPRGVHHDPAGIRRGLADHSDVQPESRSSVTTPWFTPRRRLRSCRSSSGRTTCSRWECRSPGSSFSCTQPC